MIVVIFAAALAIFLTLTRRRFGIFILAMLSGVVLNGYFGGQITELFLLAGLKIPTEVLAGLSGLVCIILPSFLLLGKSSKQPSWVFGIVQSIFVAVLFVVLCLPDLAKIFSLDVFSRDILNLINEYGKYIILGGVGLAIFDIMFTKSKKLGKK